MMKKVIASIIVTVIMGAFGTVSTSALAARGERSTSGTDEPVLIKATVFTHTNDDNKDHDTCIFAEVKTADRQTLIVHAANRDCSGSDNTEYNDGSDHQFDLDIDAPGIAKSTTQGFTVHMWQETHGGAGHDTWKFNVRIVLYFSGGGGNYTASKDGVVLVNNGAAVDFRHGQ